MTEVKRLPKWHSGKESACQCRRRHRRRGFDSWVRKIPWRRKWQPAPVCLPGESHGQRSLESYRSWGRRESDTTERRACLSQEAGFLGFPLHRHHEVEPALFFGTWSVQAGHFQTLELQGISVLSRGTSVGMRSHAAMLFVGVSLHHAAWWQSTQPWRGALGEAG